MCVVVAGCNVHVQGSNFKLSIICKCIDVRRGRKGQEKQAMQLIWYCLKISTKKYVMNE